MIVTGIHCMPAGGAGGVTSRGYSVLARATLTAKIRLGFAPVVSIE